jgi:hypothetical protein
MICDERAAGLIDWFLLGRGFQAGRTFAEDLGRPGCAAERGVVLKGFGGLDRPTTFDLDGIIGLSITGPRFSRRSNN